jgi:hypothetical protein
MEERKAIHTFCVLVTFGTMFGSTWMIQESRIHLYILHFVYICFVRFFNSKIKIASKINESVSIKFIEYLTYHIHSLFLFLFSEFLLSILSFQ